MYRSCGTWCVCEECLGSGREKRLGEREGWRQGRQSCLERYVLRAPRARARARERMKDWIARGESSSIALRKRENEQNA